MKSTDVVNILQQALRSAREAGREQISVDSLDRFAKKLEQDARDTPEGVALTEVALESLRADLTDLAADRQREHEFRVELFRSVIAVGQSALRSATLINGGAAVALLALLGSGWREGATPDQLARASEGLLHYGAGVLAGALATGFTYLSQAGYAEDFGKHSSLIGRLGHGGAIGLALAAYGLFGRATWLSYVALGSA